VALAEQRDRPPRPCSSTPPGSGNVLTSEGSPSCQVVPYHSLPLSQLPSPPSPPTGQAHQHQFETWVIPRTAAIDQEEAALDSALVAVGGGGDAPGGVSIAGRLTAKMALCSARGRCVGQAVQSH
jgi:hypothetical protein